MTIQKKYFAGFVIAGGLGLTAEINWGSVQGGRLSVGRKERLDLKTVFFHLEYHSFNSINPKL